MVVTLLYSIAGGMLAGLATARVELIAWKFLRLIGLITFALACIGTLWSLRVHEIATLSPTRTGAAVGGGAAGVAAMVIVFLAPASSAMTRAFRLVCVIGGLCGLAGCGLSALAAMNEIVAPAQENVFRSNSLTVAMIFIGQILGALLLGSITISWLLGHAYLTATKMTIAPLRHFSSMLSWSVGARIAFLVVSVLLAWGGIGGASPAVLAHLEQWWLVATLRIGVGLVAVGVFAYMVADCVRLRSTQSATGILYFGSVMAYVGELASQQLVRELGWPI